MASRETSTAESIVAAGRRLIMTNGYNGFSFADIAQAVGVRKASVHHHFPFKFKLAVEVVERSRAEILARAAELEEQSAAAALHGYTDYWERCLSDDSSAFCLAAMLAAELPSLPADLVAATRAHFRDLAAWLSAVLGKGRRDGEFVFDGEAAEQAELFMAAIYGAMLSARVFGDPQRFRRVVRATMGRLQPGG